MLVGSWLRQQGTLRGASLGLAAVALAMGCAGHSTNNGGDGSGGTGGEGASSGRGGSGGGGGSAGGAGTHCVHQGTTYQPGDSFPAGDDCNTCDCTETGEVLCTRKACAACESLSEAHAEALTAAKRCDPTLMTVQCSVLVNSGLQCGCPTFVSSKAELDAIAAEWSSRMCGTNVQCGACAEDPTRGECSIDGVCVDVVEYPDAGAGSPM